MNLCYALTEAACSVTVVAVFDFRPTGFFTDFFGPLRPVFLAKATWPSRAAFSAAQRFFTPAMIAALPAALILRFLGFGAWGGSEVFLIPAHLAFWAAAIL